jgi:hypothetical protein
MKTAGYDWLQDFLWGSLLWRFLCWLPLSNRDFVCRLVLFLRVVVVLMMIFEYRYNVSTFSFSSSPCIFYIHLWLFLHWYFKIVGKWYSEWPNSRKTRPDWQIWNIIGQNHSLTIRQSNIACWGAPLLSFINRVLGLCHRYCTVIPFPTGPTFTAENMCDKKWLKQENLVLA